MLWTCSAAWPCYPNGMPFTSTPHVASSVMQWSEVATNLADARTWVNNIPNTDVLADSVLPQHLARPVVTDFPVQGLTGPNALRQLYWRNVGPVDGAQLYKRQNWNARTSRLTIPCQQVVDRWQVAVGATIKLRKTSTVSVSVMWTILTRTNINTGPYYPTAPAGPFGVCGYFQLGFWSRATESETVLSGSRRDTYPEAATAGAWEFSSEPLYMLGRASLAAGFHDVLLWWYNTGILTGFDQIDLDRLVLNVEVL